MKKGLIVEVKKDYSIVMVEGEYFKVVNKMEMVEGGKIMFTEEELYREKVGQSIVRMFNENIYRYSAIAAMFLLVTVMGLVYYNNNMVAYAVVTMDINPSVKVELNRNDEVIDITGLNMDGVSFESVDFKGKTIEDVIEALLSKAEEEGYFDRPAYDTTHVVFTTVSLKNTEEEQRVLTAKIEGVVTDTKGLETVNIAITESTKENLEEAEELQKPLPIVTLSKEIDLGEVDTVRELFDNEDYVATLEETGKIKVKGPKKNNSNKEKFANKEKEPEKKDEQDDSTGDSEDKVVVGDVDTDENEEVAENEENGNKYGESLAVRNDLNVLKEKLQWVIDNTEDQEVIDEIEELLGEEEYDFEEYKKEALALVKELRAKGIKIKLQEETEAMLNNGGGETDEISTDGEKVVVGDQEDIEEQEEKEDADVESDDEIDDDDSDKEKSNNGKGNSEKSNGSDDKEHGSDNGKGNGKSK